MAQGNTKGGRRTFTADRLGEIPSCAERQDSVDEQLFDLRAVAYRLGLNDAVGIINIIMSSPWEKRDMTKTKTLREREQDRRQIDKKSC